MKEHPKDCPGDMCDEYICESRKRALQAKYNSWSGAASTPSQHSVRNNPLEIKACLNCNPNHSPSPSSRCGKINQFCKNPYHESVVCIPDTFIPKTWKWTERESEHLGEYENKRYLFNYQKLKQNFSMCGYPPTPTSQWAPCNTDWQLLRNENATMHYIGGRTRITLKVWACSHPKTCCTLNVNGMEDGFFNFDNRNLFECEFLSMLLERIHLKNLSIPAAYHELINDFEICHDDMPGLPVRTWVSVLDSYQEFSRNKTEYTSAYQAIQKMNRLGLINCNNEGNLESQSEVLKQPAGGSETKQGSLPSPAVLPDWLNLSSNYNNGGSRSNSNLSEVVDSISHPTFSKRMDYSNEGETKCQYPLQLQLPPFCNQF